MCEKPGAPRQDVAEPKQLRFMPELMRRRSAIGDSEGEDEEVVELKEGPENHEGGKKRPGGKGKKRSSDIMRDTEDEDTEEDAVRPAPKRIRQAAKKQSRRREPVPSIETSENGHVVTRAPPVSTSESENEDTNVPRLRRQSTMTQMVEGRRPQPGDKEPEFKPVKRGSRSSLGKTKDRDAKQQTLTQMVRGFAPVVDSEEDEETEDESLEEQTAYTNALAEHLNRSGIFEPALDQTHVVGPESEPVGMNAADDDDEEDEDYLPTQDIRPSTIAKRQTPRRTGSTALATPATSIPRKGKKPRFSLLATPERRKILEIPSSQSPPESPLSTQDTPAGRRAALRQRSGNTQKLVETPSKRKKVAFQEDVEVVKPLPRWGRKLPSQIQDSEDEDSENLEETEDESTDGPDIGAETQHMIDCIDNAAVGVSIGSETQAMLDQIDQACAITDQDEVHRGREASVELGDDGIGPPHFDGSQELGESLQCRNQRSPSPEGPSSTYIAAHIAIKQEPCDANISALPLATSRALPHVEQPGFPAPTNSRNIKEEYPSSPLVVKNEDEDDRRDMPTSLDSEPATRQHPPTCDTADLEGEIIQVRRSASPSKQETQETNRSFSSRAEQQLHSEQQGWLSYSQFPRPPPSSSMRVFQDASSYQQSPFAGPTSLRALPRQSSAALSQATTVDPTQRSPNVTPKKARSRVASTNTTPRKIPSSQRSLDVTPRKLRSRIGSTNTTPRRIPSSQPIISPQRPATLIIPSSYPSPGKLGYGGWSSPVMETSEGGESVDASILDFSLPPPPPIVDEDDE